MNIEQKRREIDVIDANIADLLNRRAAIAKDISMLKLSAGLPIVDEHREDDVLRGLARSNQGEISHAAMARIYRAILDESRLIQAAVRTEMAANGARK